MVRHHEKARKGFTPHGVKDLPVSMEKMDGKRSTVVRYQAGDQETIHDNFYTSKNPHMKMKGLWAGETMFGLVSEEQGDCVKKSEEVKRPEPREDDVDAMIACYEEDVLRAVGGGAVGSSFFEIYHSEPDVAALSEYAVPDTACRRTLIGEAVLRDLEDKLSDRGLRVVRRVEQNEFRFGNAGTLKSETVAQIPVTLGERRVVVHAAVLPGSGSQTPFLLSKELLKQLQCVMDMQSDLCVFKRLSTKSIKMKSERGHYAIPVLEGLGSKSATKPEKCPRDVESTSQRVDRRPRAESSADPREVCSESAGQGDRQVRRRRRVSHSRYGDVSSEEVQEQAHNVGSVCAGQGIPAVDSHPCGPQEEWRGDEATEALHRVHGHKQEGATHERATTRIDPADANSPQGQDESSCPRSNIHSSSPRRGRLGTRKDQPESHGVERRGRLGRGHRGDTGADRGHVPDRRVGEDEGGEQGIGSRSTTIDEVSRRMTEHESKMIEQNLEEIHAKDSSRKVDVLIITPDDKVSPTMLAEVFSVPRVCKIAESAGITCGGSYDIITGWDFRKPEKRSEMRERLSELRPRLVVLCCAHHVVLFILFPTFSF